jgi:hypothetical protein
MQRERAEAREKGKEKREKDELEKDSAGADKGKSKGAAGADASSRKEKEMAKPKLPDASVTTPPSIPARELTEQEKQVCCSSTLCCSSHLSMLSLYCNCCNYHCSLFLAIRRPYFRHSPTHTRRTHRHAHVIGKQLYICLAIPAFIKNLLRFRRQDYWDAVRSLQRSRSGSYYNTSQENFMP